jgi:hypothetical protein
MLWQTNEQSRQLGAYIATAKQFGYQFAGRDSRREAGQEEGQNERRWKRPAGRRGI